MTGMRLEEALRILSAQGLTPRVRFTQAPRRASAPEPERLAARVLRRDGDALLCARFNEPEPK